MKGKKGFCKHTDSKGKAEKNVDSQFSLTGKVVTKDMDKTQVCNACFALRFCLGFFLPSKVCL